MTIPAGHAASTNAAVSAEDVLAVLIECAGAPDQLPEGDIAELTFDDLGYDSLALIEAATRLSERFGANIPDHEIASLTTLGDLASRANG